MQQFDFSRCNIFEFGSGNSSLFWSKNAQSVISVESDPDWYTFGMQDLSPNRSLLLKTGCNEYVETVIQYETKFDVIVIDGLYRFNCAVKSMTRLKDGGIIVLDNSDWFPDTARLLRDAGFTQTDFIGAGPVNSYAWCTSVFFRGHMGIPRISDSQPVRVLGGIAEISGMDKPC
ncbi:MAG: class I SAM-dependent methyltransferase [Geobacteraceae bacterium]|nr:class I SAM-dependent methyltransferase [Geobacteraceae bacterium]